MLGRKDFTQKELDDGKAAVAGQLAAYEELAKIAAADDADEELRQAFEEFETPLFNNLTLMLDRRYVHRVRTVTGKDTNPLSEVELIVDSLLDNDGVFRTGGVVKYVPEKSVVKLDAGDKIQLTADDFERLSTAFFDTLAANFISP